MVLLQQIVTLFVLAGAVIASASAAIADDYPSHAVKVIVPFGAGGPTDVYTRAVAEELRKSLHQPFIMENRPGAGTTIGTDMVAKSQPDGYTLLMVSGTQTVNETLYAHKPYQLMRDLVPIAPLIDTDLVLVVHPSVSAKTVGELLALARAKPGTLNYGSSGPGSNYHMAGELLKNLTGIDIVHVPYKGSTGARNDILSGQIQILFDSCRPWRRRSRPGWCARSAPAEKHARRYCPMSRRWRRPACPASTRGCGSASWLPPAHRSRSSTNFTTRSPRSCAGLTSSKAGKRPAQPRL